jgi:CheY-like chemotaxis protein
MAKRILIVDDSVTIQKAFAMTFGGEDVSLMAARSAEEGLMLAQRARPDLVIADAVMPGRSGYDLCAAIRSEPTLRGVPVFILTSSHHPYDEVQARQVAADGYFVKPYDSVTLVASAVEAVARGAVASLSVATLPFGATSVPAAAAPPRLTGVMPPLGDDYGEISVGGSGPRPNATVPRREPDADVVTPPPAPPVAPPPTRPVAAPGGVSGMRPSLIPGMRPGIPTTRPGASVPARSPGMPGATAGPSAAPMPAAPAPTALPRGPVPHAPPVAMRTTMGLPAANLQAPPRAPVLTVPSALPLRPVAAPGMESRTPPPSAHASGLGAQAAAAVASRVAEKMAAISARGPEYEAIARLSREIIEKIAWEIIPELAEAIVREELQKRGRI